MPDINTIPEKFRVMGADGNPDWAAISEKVAGSYAELERRFSSQQPTSDAPPPEPGAPETPPEPPPPQVMAERDVAVLEAARRVAGSEAALVELGEWGKANLGEDDRTYFDKAVSDARANGDMSKIEMAVKWLAASRKAAGGTPTAPQGSATPQERPTMVHSAAPVTGPGDVFKDMTEVTDAVMDPRCIAGNPKYSHAYRQALDAKIARSLPGLRAAGYIDERGGRTRVDTVPR